MEAKLPFLISVPHSGIKIPPEIKDDNLLSMSQIVSDGDEGAGEIYAIENQVRWFVQQEVARAFIDLNRAPDDFRRDGVIKTHTCNLESVYRKYPDQDTINLLMERYYYPYHDNLSSLALHKPVIGIDCHTMAAEGPPVGPDPGVERPWICLSNGDGTCPDKWMDLFKNTFSRSFNGNVSVNSPFRGGYIIRSHSDEMPWIQLEISRAPFMSNIEKRRLVLKALYDWFSLL